ncbi:MAG: UDP-N-acetylmuramoyl-L-alanine--D-glutamate ligase [Lachnospiraceae bacterium]|nr:UDP-N-acetylmuramoyl-L-alanine--D-glutamate ligase [Lachnospiraceae bacterium]
MDFNGKKILVCGMAKSGISAAMLVNSLGAEVILQDIKKKEDMGDVSYIENSGIKIYDGKNPDEIIEDMDLVVVSPGIPTSLSFFEVAQKAGVKIISEVELSYIVTPCPIIAITGTNGKTTTTALTGEIIKKKYPKAAVVGNIGVPYSGEVQRLSADDYVVAEISSFQMETSDKFHPHISAVLNITPDHLDRHKTVENYMHMKEKVFANQTAEDFVILNYDDESTRKMAAKTKAKTFFFSSSKAIDEGIYLKENDIIVKWGTFNETVVPVNDLKILGTHNYENVMAAVAISICAGVSMTDIVSTLKEFGGVEHRIEFVKTVDGVDYYNDSKGTNTDAAIRGIMAMKKPCVLIGGGYDKGSEYDEWVEKFDGRVKHLVLIGKTAEKIEECCKKYDFNKISKCETFQEAVNLCKTLAVNGDCVLLSPACASWDMFNSYEQRGEIFKEIVEGF